MSTPGYEPMALSVVEEYDVIVAGGGPAGIGAGIAAARHGAKTLIVEQFGCLGGMMTSGLHTHLCILKTAQGGEDFVVGGVPMELCRRGEQRQYGEIAGSNYDYEVEAMKRDLDDWALEAGCDLLYHSFASEAAVEDGRIVGLVVQNKSGRSLIGAGRVVDCTGDADVAASAGVPFEQGREADGLCQPVTLMFRVENVGWEALREYLRDDPGCRDMCRKAIEAGDMPPFQTQLMGFWYTRFRPSQMGVNFTNLTRVDATSAGDLTRAEIECRRQVAILLEVFRRYLPGCENIYLLDTAQVIGIRESRRIVGEYVLTMDDVLALRKFEDGIARGSFFVDIHSPDDTGLFEPRHLPKGGYYDIPYRCLVPLEIDNLLVAGRCISVTHEALGSTRVMFQCMALGEAAGMAAAMSLQQQVTPRELDARVLRRELSEAGALV
jgi:hypothetical protein